MNYLEFLERSLKLTQERIPFVVVTLLGVRGHAPQDPGAKAIVTANGLDWGTVGGGKIEARCIQHSLEILKNRSHFTPEWVTWNLQKDIGMTCGGEVTYLFEFHQRSRWNIVVFGAGHIAQALIRVLSSLECEVTCVDPRKEWIERLPQTSRLQTVCISDPVEVIPKLDPDSFFVVMTQGHATDLPVLKSLMKNYPNARYLGVIGSDVKAIKIRAELLSDGFSEESVKSVQCPIGLPLGTNHPGEIAISIAAELIQRRDSMA